MEPKEESDRLCEDDGVCRDSAGAADGLGGRADGRGMDGSGGAFLVMIEEVRLLRS